jgi:hypothetical protein
VHNTGCRCTRGVSDTSSRARGDAKEGPTGFAKIFHRWDDLPSATLLRAAARRRELGLDRHRQDSVQRSVSKSDPDGNANTYAGSDHSDSSLP